MTNSLPEKLGKYKIIEEVGRGGFAAVCKAVDTTLNRTVALKILAPHLLWDPTFVQRFQREAKVAANLDHRNIVTI
jgi:serine/threonine-protein kinase